MAVNFSSTRNLKRVGEPVITDKPSLTDLANFAARDIVMLEASIVTSESRGEVALLEQYREELVTAKATFERVKAEAETAEGAPLLGMPLRAKDQDGRRVGEVEMSVNGWFKGWSKKRFNPLFKTWEPRSAQYAYPQSAKIIESFFPSGATHVFEVKPDGTEVDVTERVKSLLGIKAAA